MTEPKRELRDLIRHKVASRVAPEIADVVAATMVRRPYGPVARREG